MIKITAPAKRPKSPRPTITPVTVPVLLFCFDGGLWSTVGVKSEQRKHVTLRHQGGDRKKKSLPVS